MDGYIKCSFLSNVLCIHGHKRDVCYGHKRKTPTAHFRRLSHHFRRLSHEFDTIFTDLHQIWLYHQSPTSVRKQSKHAFHQMPSENEPLCPFHNRSKEFIYIPRDFNGLKILTHITTTLLNWHWQRLFREGLRGIGCGQHQWCYACTGSRTILAIPGASTW